ncbi:MAG TPA: hypothetical protein VGH36_14440 [Acetobacteraceae bacterium]
MPKRRTKTNGGIGFAVMAGMALPLAVGLVVTTRVLPLQDFNEWLYQGLLVKDALAGHPAAAMLKPWPVPNALTQFLLGVMMFALPPLIAGKAFIVATILAFAAMAWRLCRREGLTDYAALALLVPVVILNSDFWSGYLNFQLGLLLLMLHLLVVRDGRVLPWWQEALFAVLMFFTHALTLAFLAIHLGWRAARQRGLVRGTLRVIGVLLPALVLVAWYSRADHSHGEYIPPPGQGVAGFLLFKAYTVATYGPYQNMVFGSQGDMQRRAWLYALGVGLNGLFALVTMPPLLVAALRGVRSRRSFAESMSALTGLAAFLVLPSTMFGAVNIGSRFLVPALMFVLVSTEDWRGLRRYGAILACAAPLMVLYIGYLQSQPVIGREVDHLAVTDPVQRKDWLFGHSAYQFRASAQAAEAGNRARPIGFATSILEPR